MISNTDWKCSACSKSFRTENECNTHYKNTHINPGISSKLGIPAVIIFAIIALYGCSQLGNNPDTSGVSASQMESEIRSAIAKTPTRTNGVDGMSSVTIISPSVTCSANGKCTITAKRKITEVDDPEVSMKSSSQTCTFSGTLTYSKSANLATTIKWGDRRDCS